MSIKKVAAHLFNGHVIYGKRNYSGLPADSKATYLFSTYSPYMDFYFDALEGRVIIQYYHSKCDIMARSVSSIPTLNNKQTLGLVQDGKYIHIENCFIYAKQYITDKGMLPKIPEPESPLTQEVPFWKRIALWLLEY